MEGMAGEEETIIPSNSRELYLVKEYWDVFNPWFFSCISISDVSKAHTSNRRSMIDTSLISETYSIYLTYPVIFYRFEFIQIASILIWDRLIFLATSIIIYFPLDSSEIISPVARSTNFIFCICKTKWRLSICNT